MAQRKRTIQHPGFEFWETNSSSTYTYVQNTVALAVGYFTKGPIGIPVMVSDVNALTSIFGLPESEAEYYSFRGISEILNKGRSVTVIRFPYDNTTSPLIYNDAKKSYFDSKYRAIRGSFVVAPGSTDKYTDIIAAFEKPVKFKSLKLVSDIIDNDDILKYNVDQETAEDFIIVNKFNDFVTKTGDEYVVSVYGAGNAIRNQSLSADAVFPEPINYFETDEFGTSKIYIDDTANELLYGKNKVFWQTTGEITAGGEAITIADTYFNDLSSYYETINTYEVDVPLENYELTLTNKEDIEKYGTDKITIERVPLENIGMPSRTIKFNSIGLPELKYNSITNLKDLLKGGTAKAVVSYGETNASGTNTADKTKDLPTEIMIYDNPESDEKRLIAIQVIEVANPEIFINDPETSIGKMQSFASKYLLNYYEKDEDGNFTVLTKSYPISVQYNDSQRDPNDLESNYTWTLTLPAEYDKESGYYVDQSRAHKILVVVSRVTRSKLELGKYTFEPVEIFSGSIFKGSRNLLTNESDYIGDIINESSNIISFYGKRNYKFYNKETDIMLVEQTAPYRLSLIHNAAISPDKTNEYINLNKIVKTIEHESFDMGNVLESILRLVRNNITYTYTDVYDFGLTSVLSLINAYDKEFPVINNEKRDMYPGFYYDTSFIKDLTAVNNQFNKYTNDWKKLARKFLAHCQNYHKLSMAFIDGPRHFLLTSNLSRVDDYRLDQNDTVITGKRCQLLSIRDCTYGSINVQWWQIQNEFTYEKMWIPNSIFQASNITANDIIYNVWDAPAGHSYGQVINTFRPACNPNNDSKDRLYTNCLNYGTAWSDGTNTIEGQKTTYIDSTALNRVNVRRLMIYLERYVQSVSMRYRYQQNTSAVRNQLIHELNEEFARLKTKGALYNYRLVCDSSNNTNEIIDQNELRIAIMVQPVRTAEFIVAQFVVSKTSANLDEIVVS